MKKQHIIAWVELSASNGTKFIYTKPVIELLKPHMMVLTKHGEIVEISDVKKDKIVVDYLVYNINEIEAILICTENSDMLSKPFASKLKNFNDGDEFLIELNEKGELKLRPNGTIIIHKYTNEAKLYDTIESISEMDDIDEIKNVVNKCLEKINIKYY